MSVVNAIPFIAAGDDGYNLTRSLRFRSSASAYLNRTPASAGNRKTWTWSGWVKRGTLGSNQALMSSDVGTSVNTWMEFGFGSDDKFYLSSYSGTRSSAMVFRDPSAWYHIVCLVDTTQATEDDRFKLYVNGVLQTDSGDAFPVQNTDYGINNNQIHGIGYRNWASGVGRYFDGYLAEVNFIDGQALTPSSFGAFSIYNQWLPKKYSGTYGTNGFYLPFTNNASAATLGNDFSGNSNTWTTNNISVTAGATYDSMTDVPTLTSATAANYAVLNPLAPTFTDSSATYISQGNLLYTLSGDYSIVKSTMDFPASGKFYLEITLGASGNVNVGQVIGIMRSPAQSYATNSYITYQCLSYGYGYDNVGGIVKGAASQTTITTTSAPTNNNVIAIAFDADNQTVKWYKNNTLLYTLNLSTAPDGYYGNDGGWVFATSGYGGAPTQATNFGQRPFTYTPPSGYVALNTFNL